MTGAVIVQVLQAVALLGLGWGCHWILGRSLLRLRRRVIPHLRPSERLWTELGAVVLLLVLRVGLWLLVLTLLFTQIEGLKPWGDRLGVGLSSLSVQGLRWLSHPVVNLGRTQLSLGAALTAILTAIAIFIGARVLSQSIKTWVMAQTQMERGMQEAMATLMTYAIALLGLVILLQTLGLDLSSLTVLAGVLGLGFGLGLQELASNFVSGLTLLFEQQIRVGDFIEMEGIAGTIERISIRSTIVRTNDRRVVVLPNHLFAQKNVTNWSYQASVNRIHLPVLVAYDSDTVLVTETLIGCARMEAAVLRDPPPVVWFKGFGERAYEFALLVWIDQPQNVDPIKSALYFLIEQEFRRQGIEVPLPQQEIRFRDPQRALAGMMPQTEPPPSSPATDLSDVRSLRVLLKQVSYFAHCTNAQLRVLIEQGYRSFFQKGQIICKEGEPGECFYIILHGTTEVISEQLGQGIAQLQTGDFFGEISLFMGIPRSATVRALEEVTLFVVDHRAFKMLLQQHQPLAESIAQSLAQRQQVLKELGLLTQDSSHNKGEEPLRWIRQQLHHLFGI